MARMLRPTTTSYAGRQVDIELLDHIAETLPRQRVHPDAHSSQRMVTGIEKAVQRYAKLFLTGYGSVRTAPGVGSNLLREIGLGMVQSEADLDHLCSVADINALAAMRDDDSDERYGAIPDDERVVSTVLDEISLDRINGRAHVKVTLETASGDGYVFTIPVSAGLSA